MSRLTAAVLTAAAVARPAKPDSDRLRDRADRSRRSRLRRRRALYALQHSSYGPFFACPGSIVRVGASPPHAVVYAGLSRPSAFTIGPDGAFYVSNRGASAGIGEVLRIEP